MVESESCIIEPEMTRENYLWTDFSLNLSIFLSQAKRGMKIEGADTLEKFLKCLDELGNPKQSYSITEVVCEDSFLDSQSTNPKITYHDIHCKLALFLANETGISYTNPHRSLTHLGSKRFYKLVGDLKNCCKNILKGPEKRQKFGHEAEIFEKVIQYFLNHPCPERHREKYWGYNLPTSPPGP